MRKKYIIWALEAALGFVPLLNLHAQYDPPAGQTGSLAIHYTDARFKSWASQFVSATRGLQQINQPNLGQTSSGANADVLGQANEGGTFSLGDGGQIVVGFDIPIVNGQGADFVVFENGFSDTFLELAFVEVSSDGQHFVRFSAVSSTPTDTQIGTFGAVDASKVHNLAGKYRAGYGVGFDLEELKDSANLDVQNVRFVRMVDVVGSIQPAYASRDSRGQLINEPFPTPFDTGGFDLDAVGVLNQAYPNAVFETANEPNPHLQRLENGDYLFDAPNDAQKLSYFWTNLQGQTLAAGQIKPNHQIPALSAFLPAGVYVLNVRTEYQLFAYKIIITK
jgi:hypothetical protein